MKSNILTQITIALTIAISLSACMQNKKSNKSSEQPASGSIISQKNSASTKEKKVRNAEPIDNQETLKMEGSKTAPEEVLIIDCEADESIVISEYVNMEQEVEEEPILYMAERTIEESTVLHNTEEYSSIVENEFNDVTQHPLSTMSIDVDNASYSNIRRYLNNSQLPPKGAIRIEEMINYFNYDYPDPNGEHPFTFITEISDCPWTKENKVVHIGIQGKRIDNKDIKPSNLVFLIDVSGSMADVNKLPLLKQSFNLLLEQLDDKDKVSIVVYAGAAGLVLPCTPASEKEKIRNALNNLQAGGSTAGGQGILLAYNQAKEAFIKDGNNRVILATDGDFNVGISATSSLVELIEEKRKDDIYLTIVGLGMGNYKDIRMEEISNAGNGNYFYIDNIKEAEKVFVNEMRANMYTIAKDVKIQIEFNPLLVKSYRLIGYENRVLAKEDFNDDKKDAGELGAGHTVTALYEIVPVESSVTTRKADELKYQKTKIKKSASANNELMTIKFRYKLPKEEISKLIVHPIINEKLKLSESSDNFRFSAAVACFGMLLKDSKFKGTANLDVIEKLAQGAKGEDKSGYRTEFISMVRTAKLLNASL